MSQKASFCVLTVNQPRMTREDFKQEAQRIRPLLIRTARRYLEDADEAEDTVQDVLLRLWQMAGELKMPLDRLAVVLTRNFSVDKLRRRRPHVPIERMADMSADDAGNERLEHLMKVLGTLPEMQQAIVRMRHMEGLEMAEIAELIGTSEVAVRKSLSRARQSILKKMNNEKSRGN